MRIHSGEKPYACEWPVSINQLNLLTTILSVTLIVILFIIQGHQFTVDITLY